MEITYSLFGGRKAKSYAEISYPEVSEARAMKIGQEFWNQIEHDGYQINSMRIGLNGAIASITI